MTEHTSSKPSCCGAGRNQIETGFVNVGKLERKSGALDITARTSKDNMIYLPGGSFLMGKAFLRMAKDLSVQ